MEGVDWCYAPLQLSSVAATMPLPNRSLHRCQNLLKSATSLYIECDAMLMKNIQVTISEKLPILNSESLVTVMLAGFLTLKGHKMRKSKGLTTNLHSIITHAESSSMILCTSCRNWRMQGRMQKWCYRPKWSWAEEGIILCWLGLQDISLVIHGPAHNSKNVQVSSPCCSQWCPNIGPSSLSTCWCMAWCTHS